MYRQMDGYPSGHGQELAEFLSKFTIVNGIGLTDGRKIANGVECLAAQIVAHFKTDVGGFYLHAGSERDAKGAYGEEYIYEVFADTFNTKEGIKIACYDVYAKKEIFYGTPQEFLEFAKLEQD